MTTEISAAADPTLLTETTLDALIAADVAGTATPAQRDELAAWVQAAVNTDYSTAVVQTGAAR